MITPGAVTWEILVSIIEENEFPWQPKLKPESMIYYMYNNQLCIKNDDHSKMPKIPPQQAVLIRRPPRQRGIRSRSQVL